MSYTYDAWGRLLDTAGALKSTLGVINPLRYRGYFYDTETGLYYLGGRYYDPGVGRFINADVYVSTGQGFVGNNMFAYCLNNPICFSDQSGHEAVAVSLTVVGVSGLLTLVDGVLLLAGGLLILGIASARNGTGIAMPANSLVGEDDVASTAKAVIDYVNDSDLNQQPRNQTVYKLVDKKRRTMLEEQKIPPDENMNIQETPRKHL